MHILLLHEYFLRPGQGGGERFNVMTKAWVRAGANVTVIAGQTHYATGRKPARARKRLLENEMVDGVRVLRPWTPDEARTSTAKRIGAMAAWGVAATATLPVVGKWDVCIATSPSLATFTAGLAAARRGPVVAEVRDLWPESAITVGVMPEHHPATAAAWSLEETMYETAAHIVALTPGIRRNIIDRGLARGEDVTVLPNGAVERPLVSEFERRSVRRARGWEEKFVVIYTGAHGKANDLGQLVTTAARLRDEPIVFALVGDGPEKATLQRRAGPNVEFIDPVDHDELRRLLGAADAGAVVLQRNPTFRTVYPNKLFDYMAAGLPVLCGVEGDAAELVDRADCGVLVRPGDIGSWRKAGLELRETNPLQRKAMGKRGRNLVLEEFDRQQIAEDYLELLITIASSS